MVNSRQKGARGERLWASKCREEGYDARRGQQFAGGTDSPDVICEDLAAFHFEVKNVERFNAWNAMHQAMDDAGEKMPVVAYKRNHHGWLVVMRADDWFSLVRGL